MQVEKITINGQSLVKIEKTSSGIVYETVIQRAEYIEDGWFIKSDHDSQKWEAYEICQYGGEEMYCGTFATVEEAHYYCTTQLL